MRREAIGGIVPANARDDGERPARPSLDALGLDALLDRMRDAIVVADTHGDVVAWNPAASAIFGYSASEAKRLNVEKLVPQELLGRHRAGIARFDATGHGPLVDSRLPVELNGVRKDGSRVLVELTLSPIHVEGKQFVLAVIRDVTDRARLEASLAKRAEDLESLNAALRDANQALEAFSYVVSHDLKEPVRALGVLLSLARSSPVAAERDELLSRAVESNAAAAVILRGLLDWSLVAIAAEEREPVRADELLSRSEVRQMFADAAQSRGVRVDVSAGLPPALASPVLLAQALGNLVLNAVKHAASGGVVRVHAIAPTGGRVAIAVDDDGPGFPEEVLARFASAAVAPTSLRTGFGLAIARRAVERIGGKLTLANRPGGGARATIELDRAP